MNTKCTWYLRVGKFIIREFSCIILQNLTQIISFRTSLPFKVVPILLLVLVAIWIVEKGYQIITKNDVKTIKLTHEDLTNPESPNVPKESSEIESIGYNSSRVTSKWIRPLWNRSILRCSFFVKFEVKIFNR